MIKDNDVKYIANLARIHLEAEEIEKLTKDLENILLYIAKLQELDVTQVKPTSHTLHLENVYREDMVKPSLDHAVIKKLAVAYTEGSFRVPKVIE